MPTLPTLSAVAAGVLVTATLSAALTWAVTRRLSEADRPGPRSADTDGTVVCLGCGAENDPRYRYCRACVAALPVAPASGGRGSPPASRLIR